MCKRLTGAHKAPSQWGLQWIKPIKLNKMTLLSFSVLISSIIRFPNWLLKPLISCLSHKIATSGWWKKDYFGYTCPKHFYCDLSKGKSLKMQTEAFAGLINIKSERSKHLLNFYYIRIMKCWEKFPQKIWCDTQICRNLAPHRIMQV